MPSGSILLADDEEKILKTLGRALREEGHDVVTTPSATEAQRLLVERSFDLRPGAIISGLDLRRPIYRPTAAYGHFGRSGKDFTWEQTPRVDELRQAVGLKNGHAHAGTNGTGDAAAAPAKKRGKSRAAQLPAE